MPVADFGAGLAGGQSSPLGMGSGSMTPSDPELERAVQDILRSADLNTITKREVRRTLEEQFGMDLTAKKSFINGIIDRTSNLSCDCRRQNPKVKAITVGLADKLGENALDLGPRASILAAIVLFPVHDGGLPLPLFEYLLLCGIGTSKQIGARPRARRLRLHELIYEGDIQKLLHLLTYTRLAWKHCCAPRFSALWPTSALSANVDDLAEPAPPIPRTRMKPALRRAATAFRRRPLPDQLAEGGEKKSKKRLWFRRNTVAAAGLPGPSVVAFTSESSAGDSLVKEADSDSDATPKQPSATVNTVEGLPSASTATSSQAGLEERRLVDVQPFQDHHNIPKPIALVDSGVRVGHSEASTTPSASQATTKSTVFARARNTTVQTLEAMTAGGNVERNQIQVTINASLLSLGTFFYAILKMCL
ncbi:hypothetical protein NMY22_g12430 [Coprinellus aureogranulatus]|nr:hypothetical protein NMY22_g12430 [Coprinellus aureogranulatus]